MDCLCEILNALCNSFIFDKLWWKDYGIPLLGAMAIPLLVWFLTWYYGAEKAEERRELRELRDNLNLLLSVCFGSIDRMVSLRKEFLYIHNIEQDNEIQSNNTLINQISEVFFSPNDFKYIDISKYSPCIEYSSNYVLNLLNLKNGLDIKDFLLEHRNQTLKKAIDSNDKKQIKGFIEWDINEFEKVLIHIEKIIICLRFFIIETKDLENKIDGLQLDSITYSDDKTQLFAELEQKYAKEQKND